MPPAHSGSHERRNLFRRSLSALLFRDFRHPIARCSHGRTSQLVRIYLPRTAENDAVAIDHIRFAIDVKRSQDLARYRVRGLARIDDHATAAYGAGLLIIQAAKGISRILHCLHRLICLRETILHRIRLLIRIHHRV